MSPRLALVLACLALACAPPSAGVGADSGSPPDAGSDSGAPIDAALALRADAGESRYALVGEEISLDASASTGAVEYEWAFGDGTTPARSASPIARHAYAAPGRYSAVLTVYDARGRRRSDTAVVSVTRPVVEARASSSSVAVVGDHLLAVVSPDSDEITIARWDDTGALSVVRRLPVCDEPRTLARAGARVVVACRGDAIAIVDPAGAGAPVVVPLPYGARPFGVVATDDAAWVTLSGPGEVAEIALGASPALTRRVAAIADARGIARASDGRLIVTRWRSPDGVGQFAIVDPRAASSEVHALAHDPQIASDTEIGGTPGYLEQALLSPDGTLLVFPSLQAAIDEGHFRTGGLRALTFQTTVRAIVSYAEWPSGAELFERRQQLDNRGFASAAVWSSRGDYLYVATRGNRTVERLDVLAAGQLSGSIDDVGYALSGLALSPDDRFLFAEATLSRELVSYDVTSFVDPPAPISRLTIPSSEPLAADVLRGAQLFSDSADPRLSRDGYVACAHCHLDGESDLLTWDFTDRGEGLRNTISLAGTAGTAHGPVHWSGNFDEIQDFEHDIRAAFRGTGLMTDAEFHTGTRDTTLGDPKAGVSSDLDALAAYVASLSRYPRSPRRAPDGSLTASAARGRIVFESAAAGCTTCHSGARLTDSVFESRGAPRLHDVGTLGAASGGRLGGALSGIDTPTLHGLHASAPYLHDGSAATLRAVLTTRNPDDRHGRTSHLSAAELDDLESYLLSLDGRPD